MVGRKGGRVWNNAQRLVFADFLDRLARNVERPGEWADLVVNHYPDDVLEEIRCSLVRLSHERNPLGAPEWLGSDREQILEWAAQLRDPGLT